METKDVVIAIETDAHVRTCHAHYPMAEDGAECCSYTFNGYMCTRPHGHSGNVHVAYVSGGEPIGLCVTVKLGSVLHSVLDAGKTTINIEALDVPPQVTITPPKPYVPEKNDVIVQGKERFLVLDRADVLRIANIIESNLHLTPTLCISNHNCYLTWVAFKPTPTMKLEKHNA